MVAESRSQASVATFPPGAAFNVIVDGAQANGCRTLQTMPLFTDGFEEL